MDRSYRGAGISEADENLIREVAKLELQTVLDLRRVAWEQHSANYKWLNASLLAVNGGAALALLSSSKIQTDLFEFSIAMFVTGILFALLNARLGQFFVGRTIPGLQRMAGYWLHVAIDGARNEGTEDSLNAQMKGELRFIWTAQACGWASIVAFVSGVILAAVGLK
ncbi:MAG: hypothetical protein ACTHKR_12265 [Sphingomonas sp.]